MSVNDIWSSLQAEENEKRLEYKQRCENIKKKTASKYGDDFNLVEMMQKLSKPSKKKSLNGKKDTNQLTANENDIPRNIENARNEGNDATMPSSCENPKEKISLQDLYGKISKAVVGCNAEEAAIRKKSLETIIDEAFLKHELSPMDYSKLFRETCKEIFRLFGDSSEKCRDLSLLLSQKLFESSIDMGPVLSFFFPALMQRLPENIDYDEELEIFVYDKAAHDAYKRGKAVDRQDKVNPSEATIIPFKYTEQSEEIRLRSYHVIMSLIMRMSQLNAASILKPYFNDIMMFLQIGLRDSYPEVKLHAMDALIYISKLLDDFELGLKYYAVAIVRALLPVLRHRHSKVRAVAVNCITAYFIVPDKSKRKGAGTNAITDLIGYKEENVLSIASFYKSQIQINYLAELVQDNTIQVREATVNMLDYAISEMPDRYDHIPRLIPYLLDFLTDDNHPNIIAIAWNCLIKCGKQYEYDHPEDIVERRQYGVDGDHRMNFDKPLPTPFYQRPRIGIRLFVRGHIKRFLKALINEIMSWKSETRLKSVKLFKIAVIFSEESVTIESSSMFPVLLKALYYTKYEENDSIVYENLIESIELLGRFIHPNVYLHYLLPRLRGDVEIVGVAGIDSNTKVIVMEIINAMVSGTKPIEMTDHINDILNCLNNEYIISRDSIILQSGAVNLMITLLQATIEIIKINDSSSVVLSIDECFETLFHALIHSSVKQSISQTNHVTQSSYRERVITAMNLLKNISTVKNYLSSDSLFDLFIVYGGNYLKRLITMGVECLEDTLPIMSTLFQCPCSIVSGNDGLVVMMIDYLIDAMKNIQSTEVLSNKLSLSEELSVNLCLILNECQSFVSSDKDRPLVESAVYKQLFDFTVYDKRASKHTEIMDYLAKNFKSISELFIHHHIWTLSMKLQTARLNLVSELFNPVRQSRDCHEDILNESVLMRLELSDLTHILAAAILPCVRNGIQPSSHHTIRMKTVDIIGSVLYLISNRSGLSIQRLKNLTEFNVTETILETVHPFIILLIDALSDGNDDVRYGAVENLRYSIPFIVQDDQYPGRTSFCMLMKCMITQFIDSCSTSITMTNQHDFTTLIDEFLHLLAVLDPIKFESILRENIQDGNDEFKVKVSELIDHASILAQLLEIRKN